MSQAARPALAMPTPAPLAPPEDFGARLAALGVELGAAAVAQLGDYLARLLAMNELVNLTAIAEPAAAWERHALDALTLVPLLADLGPGARLVDVGSGGGVPGIPLAIARPDLEVTLIEATQKKAAFLAAVADVLGLHNVTVRAERAELLANGELRGAFDAVTARAVGRLVALVPLTAQRCVHERTVPTPTGRIVVLRRGEGEPRRRRP